MEIGGKTMRNKGEKKTLEHKPLHRKLKIMLGNINANKNQVKSCAL
jgi:hypothetical protein